MSKKQMTTTSDDSDQQDGYQHGHDSDFEEPVKNKDGDDEEDSYGETIAKNQQKVEQIPIPVDPKQKKKTHKRKRKEKSESEDEESSEKPKKKKKKKGSKFEKDPNRIKKRVSTPFACDSKGDGCGGRIFESRSGTKSLDDEGQEKIVWDDRSFWNCPKWKCQHEGNPDIAFSPSNSRELTEEELKKDVEHREKRKLVRKQLGFTEYDTSE